MRKEGSWQELLRLMRRNKKIATAGKLAAGAASITLLSVGGHEIWKQFRQGNGFRPELFANNQALHGNQITFPEREEYRGQDQTSEPGANERLQHDRHAADEAGRENQDRVSFELDEKAPEALLDEVQKMVVEPAEGAGREVPPANLPENTVLLAPKDRTEGEALHTGGTITGGTHAGTMTYGGSAESQGSGSDSTSAGTGGSGVAGGGSQTPGAAEPIQPEQPTQPEQPQPQPEPVPAPDPATPVTPPDPTPSEPVYDPDYPDDSKRPQLPGNPFSMGSSDDMKQFPDSGVDTDKTAEQTVTLHIDDLWEADSSYLYEGAVLTDWKLLCSILAYADIYEDGTLVDRYRITDYSELFRVGEYPQTAEENMTVSFYFRPNTQSEWQEVRHTFDVKYAKLIVLNAPDENGEQTELKTRYLDKNEAFYLGYATNALFDANPDWVTDEFGTLDKIFPGWSEEKDGELLHTRYYKPEKGGRYLLYPQERTEIPEGWSAFLDNTMSDPLETAKLTYAQNLYFDGWDDTEDCFEIPEGVQYCNLSGITVNKVVVPASLWQLDADWNPPQEAFEAAKENPYLSSLDGILYNGDQTELLGIPQNISEIDIPASVKKVNLSFFCDAITKLVFHSMTPPEIDLTALAWNESVTIQIPAGSYVNYQYAWGKMLAECPNIMLEVPDGADETYAVIGNGLFSADGKILYGVLDGCSGFYQIPDNTEIVAENALASKDGVDSLYVPESVTRFESGSLAGSGLNRIYFSSQTPPELAESVFCSSDEADEPVRVWVPEGCSEAYRNAWGTEVTDQIELLEGFTYEDGTNTEGVRYLNTEEDGGILLEVPAMEKPFTFEDLPEDINWTEIGSNAFRYGSVDDFLEVPESVTTIGSNAFSACSDLKYLLFHAKDSIFIGKGAFAETAYSTSLDFVAFDAMEMVFEDGASENNIRLNYLAPEGSNPVSLDGNEVSAIAYGDRYVAEQAGDGYLIYAVSDGMLDLDQGSWLMGATAGVSGEFVVPDGYPLHYVKDFAMQNCQDSGNTFTIPPEIASEIWCIGSYAFFNIGLSGSLELSDSLYSIGSGAFESCDQLTGISILPGEDPADSLSIGGQAFAESGLESVILPGNLTDLSSYVFYGCSDLTSVTFCSAEPPELVSASWGIPFEFGFEDNEAVTLEFPDDVDAESYIEWWKYALCGFSILSDEADMEAELYNDLLWSGGAFDPYVDEWLEEDSPVYEEDGVTYRRAYTAYCADAARYKLQQMLYEKAVMVCEWLGASEADLIPPMEEKPDITVYQDESIFEELVEVPDAGLAEDLPVADLDPKDVIEIETPDADQTGVPDKASEDHVGEDSGQNSSSDHDADGSSDRKPDADDAETGEDASGKDDAESGENASGKHDSETGEDDSESGDDAPGKNEAESGEDASGKNDSEKDDSESGEDVTGKNDAETGEDASGKNDAESGNDASGKDDAETTGDASDEDASESANNASDQNCEGSKDLLTPTSYNTRG